MVEKEGYLKTTTGAEETICLALFSAIVDLLKLWHRLNRLNLFAFAWVR